jgi:integrase/recombinase XerD
VVGGLAPFAVGFRECLGAQGYTSSSAVGQVLLMAQLSRWLGAVGLNPGDLTPERIDQFAGANRAAGYVRFPLSPRGFDQLIGYLRSVGAVPLVPMAVLSRDEELLARYRSFLLVERGLAAVTVAGYVHIAAGFLKALAAQGVTVDVDHGLVAGDVHRFVLAETSHRGVASMKNLVNGLRSLLRFLHVDGIVLESLSGAVPRVSDPGDRIPHGVSAEAVASLLASCDRQTEKGNRDFAVFTMLARLGLRAAEVCRLRVDDIDWRNGVIMIRGKGNRPEEMPLPVDLGDALAAYLQSWRPKSVHRELFLRVLAPRTAITSGSIFMTLRRTWLRAGLATVGPHRLRHTVAEELLRHGAGLPEIGQLLRHRSLESTVIYAKVDTVALRDLARPWPTSAS